jgi:hypothetical protein
MTDAPTQDTFFGLGNRKFTEVEMQQIATGVADAISKKYPLDTYRAVLEPE